ncbi:MAG: response regulator, partial [Bacteroidetes bacterium]|nr:response regulator [Bacteroidota bacterium]
MKIKILIVDDREDNLYLLESLLKGNGYMVTSTSNGEEALQAAINNPPDLIISDILMPVMDGYTLCRKLKSNNLLKNIPLVFYTATYTDAKDEEFAQRIGADRFILKPCDPDELIEIIKDVLNSNKKEVVLEQEVNDEHETIVLKEYNSVLITKLEKKMRDIEIANKELIKSQEHLQKLNLAINSSKDVVFMTDTKGIITYINSEFTNMYGYTPEAIIGKTTPRILKSGLINSKSYEKLWGNITNKINYTDQFINKCKDNKLIDVEISADPILDNNGEIIGFLAIQSDITERKQFEKELIQSKEKAEESEKLKTEFLAQMSHEIRTPLNIIINNSSYLKQELKESLDEDFQFCFNSMDIASKRIIRTVDLILNMSEIQTGSFNLWKNNVDLVSQIITPLVKEHSILAKIKNINFNFKTSADNSTLYCDEYCVTQIIANLIDNAIKYTSKGNVEVSLFENEKAQLVLE